MNNPWEGAANKSAQAFVAEHEEEQRKIHRDCVNERDALRAKLDTAVEALRALDRGVPVDGPVTLAGWVSFIARDALRKIGVSE